MTARPSREEAAARSGRHEPRWPASVAVVAALALYVTLPDRLTFGPTWPVAALEAALLIPLSVARPHRHHAEPPAARVASIALVALVNLANIISLVLLVHLLLVGGKAGGRQLVVSSIQIWLTNVIIFGLWYWELDRRGPGARTGERPPDPDFLFPQMSQPAAATAGWRPRFIDYLYVSLTNATAFSPTDTMPLTPMAKALMGLQALVSLITVALVAARAVNVLG